MEKFKVPQVKAGRFLLWWGRFRFMFGHAMFYVSMVNMGLLAATAYNTTIRDWASEYFGIQLTFWVFLLIMFGLIVVGFIVEYVISVPALIAISNEQMYAHQSPIVEDFNDVKRKLNLVMEKLEIEDTETDREKKKK